jgi:hypothetical protein
MEATEPSASIFPTVFSPTKYGKHDALMLNSLKWVMTDYNLHCRHRVGAAQASGSEEADSLAMHYVFYPSEVTFPHIHMIFTSTRFEAVEEVRAIALLDLFMPEFVQSVGTSSYRTEYLAVYGTDPYKQYAALGDVTRQVMQLSERLYRRPRMEAFLLGNSLGSGSVVIALSDDICKRILELSFAE